MRRSFRIFRQAKYSTKGGQKEIRPLQCNFNRAVVGKRAIKAGTMTLHINQTEDGQFIELIGTGTVCVEDVIEAIQQVYSGPNFKSLRYQLVDYTTVEKYEGNLAGSRQLVELDKKAIKTNSTMRIAIVAPTDIIFGSARYWEIHLADSALKTHVFRDRQSAVAWLFQ